MPATAAKSMAAPPGDAVRRSLFDNFQGDKRNADDGEDASSEKTWILGQEPGRGQAAARPTPNALEEEVAETDMDSATPSPATAWRLREDGAMAPDIIASWKKKQQEMEIEPTEIKPDQEMETEPTEIKPAEIKPADQDKPTVDQEMENQPTEIKPADEDKATIDEEKIDQEKPTVDQEKPTVEQETEQPETKETKDKRKSKRKSREPKDVKKR